MSLQSALGWMTVHSFLSPISLNCHDFLGKILVRFPINIPTVLNSKLSSLIICLPRLVLGRINLFMLFMRDAARSEPNSHNRNLNLASWFHFAALIGIRSPGIFFRMIAQLKQLEVWKRWEECWCNIETFPRLMSALMPNEMP